MRKNLISFGCVLAAIAVGVAVAVMLSDIATVKAGWCDARPNCFREWVSATSGWAAAAGALVTIIVLWKTLDHMRVSSQQQLRAYIAVADTMMQGAENFFPVFNFEIKNFGQTPGYDVALTSNYFYGEFKGEFEGVSETTRSLGVLAPGGSHTMSQSFSNLNNEMYEAIRQGKMCIQIKLVITYLDAFGHRRESFVRYRTSERTRLKDGPVVTVEASTNES